MSRFLAVPGTNTIEACFQASPIDALDHALTRPAFDFYRRGRRSVYDNCSFVSLWPTRSGFQSDPASPAGGIMSDDMMHSDGFEPWSASWGGNQGQKFLSGQALDSVGAGVSGATIQLFRTSDDALIHEVGASATGHYEVGYMMPGIQHYIVAYRAGSPDITGATVNTLTGTNRDGT